VELIERTWHSDDLPDIQRLVLPGGGKPSFQTLLDEVCDRLQDARLQGSLRRIQKLEETLNVLERELEEYLALRAGTPLTQDQ